MTTAKADPLWLAVELSKVNWRQVVAALMPTGVTLGDLFEMTPHQLAATVFEPPPPPFVDHADQMRRINERRAAKGERPVWSKPLRDELRTRGTHGKHDRP